MSWQLEKPIKSCTTAVPQGSDSFSATMLHPQWFWNHQPDSDAWSLTERRGWLRLKARCPLSKRHGFFGTGGTVAQRYMQSDTVIATIRMDVRHLGHDGRAGLVIFNGGKSYACIGMKEGQLAYEENGKEHFVGQMPTKVRTIYLRANIKFNAKAQFSYSIDNRHYHPLDDLYQLVPGNFRGAMIGLFCYGNGRDCGYVDIDWFDYKIRNR